MAFFDGHETYESVEAFVYRKTTPEGGQPVRAILTRHDNSQVDYVNFQEDNRSGRERYKTSISFEYRENGRGGMLSFTDHNGFEVVLVYVAENPVSAEWGGLTDAGEHSPDGGLPLFYRDTSGIGSEGCYVRINGQRYHVPEDKLASRRPWFIGLMAYISEGFNSAIYPTGIIKSDVEEFRAGESDKEIVVSQAVMLKE